MMKTYRISVFQRIREGLFPIAEDNKNIQTAAASLILNYVVSNFDEEAQVECMDILAMHFLTLDYIHDWEARFRVLVSLGTLLAAGPEAVEYGKSMEVKDGVRSWRLMEGPAKVTECCQFIENIL